MPQLNTAYIFTFFLWTWWTLYLLMKKIKALPMIKIPQYQHKNNLKPYNNLPWT